VGQRRDFVSVSGEQLSQLQPELAAGPGQEHLHDPTRHSESEQIQTHAGAMPTGSFAGSVRILFGLLS